MKLNSGDSHPPSQKYHIYIQGTSESLHLGTIMEDFYEASLISDFFTVNPLSPDVERNIGFLFAICKPLGLKGLQLR